MYDRLPPAYLVGEKGRTVAKVKEPNGIEFDDGDEVFVRTAWGQDNQFGFAKNGNPYETHVRDLEKLVGLGIYSAWGGLDSYSKEIGELLELYSTYQRMKNLEKSTSNKGPFGEVHLLTDKGLFEICFLDHCSRYPGSLDEPVLKEPHFYETKDKIANTRVYWEPHGGKGIANSIESMLEEVEVSLRYLRNFQIPQEKLAYLEGLRELYREELGIKD